MKSKADSMYRHRETGKAMQAIKTLKKLKFMLSLVDEAQADGDTVEWSELDADKDTAGTLADGVKTPFVMVTLETYLEIVGEFETILPYVEDVLKHSKR